MRRRWGRRRRREWRRPGRRQHGRRSRRGLRRGRGERRRGWRRARGRRRVVGSVEVGEAERHVEGGGHALEDAAVGGGVVPEDRVLARGGLHRDSAQLRDRRVVALASVADGLAHVAGALGTRCGTALLRPGALVRRGVEAILGDAVGGGGEDLRCAHAERPAEGGAGATAAAAATAVSEEGRVAPRGGAVPEEAPGEHALTARAAASLLVERPDERLGRVEGHRRCVQLAVERRVEWCELEGVRGGAQRVPVMLRRVSRAERPALAVLERQGVGGHLDGGAHPAGWRAVDPPSGWRRCWGAGRLR